MQRFCAHTHIPVKADGIVNCASVFLQSHRRQSLSFPDILWVTGLWNTMDLLLVTERCQRRSAFVSNILVFVKFRLCDFQHIKHLVWAKRTGYSCLYCHSNVSKVKGFSIYRTVVTIKVTFLFFSNFVTLWYIVCSGRNCSKRSIVFIFNIFGSSHNDAKSFIYSLEGQIIISWIFFFILSFDCAFACKLTEVGLWGFSLLVILNVMGMYQGF